MKKIITKSERETMRVGERLAKGFRGGETVALEGDLGTGKTTLIKGVARGLGVKRNVSSPTFVLMKVHEITNRNKKLETRNKKLCHVDAYRIKNGQELLDIGVREYLEDAETVTVIEWAEKVRGILPKDVIWVKMGYGKKENERVIIIDN